MCTDSSYAFSIIHAHGAIWKVRAMLNANNYKGIKYGKEVLRLLEAIKDPKEVAVVHCQGHQRDNQRLYREIIWQLRWVKRLQCHMRYYSCL